MKADKAARISSYLVRNSARVSMMNRNPVKSPDPYKKADIAEQTDRPRTFGKRLPKVRKNAWGWVSFVLIMIMLLMSMRMM